jgi:hypothetical protein
MRNTFFVLALFLSGCAHPFRPETPHPSPERMRTLLDAPVVVPHQKASTFELKVSSPVVFVGNAVRLTCYVPDSIGRGVINLGIPGLQVQSHVIDSPQTILLIDHIDICGELTAVCEVVTPAGTKRDEKTIQIKGGLCDSSGN